MKGKLSVILLLLACSGFSQDLTYSVVSNNLNTGFVRANVDPFNILLSDSRMSFSGQAGIRFYKAGVYLNFSGDYHYLDNLAAVSDRMYGESVYAPQRSRNINGMVGYLFTWTKHGNVHFLLKSKLTFNGSVDYVAKVKMDYKRYFGVEGGFTAGYSFLTAKQYPALQVIDYYSGAKVSLTNNFSTYMQYNWLVMGVSFGDIVNSELDFSGYGKRNAMYMRRYYAHVLMAVHSQLDDIFFTTGDGSNNTLYYRYTFDNSSTLSNIGFNAGWEFIPLKQLTGLGFETGFMPGIRHGGNFYVRIKMSLNFGSRF